MGFAADRAFQQGNLDATVETWRQLVELDPLSAMNRGNYGVYLVLTGRYDEAELQIRKSLELNPDRHWDIHLELAHIHVLQRDHDAALAEILKMPQDVRDWGMALLHGAPAHAADADAALRRLAALPPNTQDVLLAELYAMRGRHDDAFAALVATRDAIERSYARSPQLRSRIHGFQMDMLRSPHLQPLHADARWQRLLERPQGAEYEAA
jgi:tetratricopeptide (TPR) repeat protein